MQKKTKAIAFLLTLFMFLGLCQPISLAMTVQTVLDVPEEQPGEETRQEQQEEEQEEELEEEPAETQAPEVETTAIDNLMKAQEILADGVYSIDIALWHATNDATSTGNGALKPEGTLIVKDGKATLHFELVSLKMMGSDEYLSELNKLSDVVVENGKLVSYTVVPANVLTTYDVVDDYNNESSTDDRVRGKKYPKDMSIEVELGEEYTYAQMYIPVMGAMGMGEQTARLKLDYSSLKESVNKTALKIKLAQAKEIKSEDYTKASFSALQSAIETAESVLNTSNSQSEIDAQVIALQRAIDNLVEAQETIKDGVYQIDVALWHATNDQASMGNQAINPKATLEVRGGIGRLYFQMTKLNNSGLEGYLSELNLLEDIVFNEFDYPVQYTKIPATVHTTYDEIDEYNANTSTDDRVRGVLYPDELSVEVVPGQEYTWSHVYIPIMGSFGFGDQITRIKLDYSSLAPGVSTIALKEKIFEAKAIAGDGYTQDSYEALQMAIASAQDVLNSSSDQSEIDAQVTALQAAISALEPLPGEVTDGIYNIKMALWNATIDQPSMGNSAIVPEARMEIKDGKTTLYFSMTKMEFIGMEGYLSEFNTLTDIEFNEFNYPSQYTKIPPNVLSTYAVIDEFNAETSTDDRVRGKLYPHEMSVEVEFGEEYTWAHIYVPIMGALNSGDQIARLKLDYSTLEKVNTVDTSKLSQKLAEAKGIEQGDYTQASYEALQQAIAAAENVLGTENVLQSAIDAQVTALQKAMDNLTRIGDKTALRARVEDAMGMAKGNYTQDSYNALQSAITSATAVLDNPDAVQAQIDSALQALNSAIAGLTTNDTGGGNGGQDNNGGNTQGNTGGNTALNKDNLQDGKYQVTIDFWHSSSNQPSMGNAALNHTAIIDVKNGVYTMSFSTRPMVIGNITAVVETVQIQQKNGSYTYANVIANNNGGKPSAFRFVMPTKNEYTNIRIDPKVEPMGNEPVAARLKISWASLVKVSEDTKLSENTTAQVSDGSYLSAAKTLADGNIGAKILADENVLPEGTKMTIEAILEGEAFELAKTALADVGSKFVLYDITLRLEDEIIQPNGSVTVVLPKPEDFDEEKIEVYRINEDGTKTFMASAIDEGQVHFDTTHFSLYAIVERDQEVKSAAASDVRHEEDTPLSAAKRSNTLLWLVLSLTAIIIAASAIVIIKNKKKQNASRRG